MVGELWRRCWWPRRGGGRAGTGGRVNKARGADEVDGLEVLAVVARGELAAQEEVVERDEVVGLDLDLFLFLGVALLLVAALLEQEGCEGVAAVAEEGLLAKHQHVRRGQRLDA